MRAGDLVLLLEREKNPPAEMMSRNDNGDGRGYYMTQPTYAAPSVDAAVEKSNYATDKWSQDTRTTRRRMLTDKVVVVE